jgi:hypothetical protein
VSFKIEGFKELERALATELPKATARNAMRRAATESMEPMRERMSQLAPYDPADLDEDGQHLRDSMRTQTATARVAREIGTARDAGVVVLTGPAPVGKRARANAGWQEYGTVKMGAKSYARVAADSEAPVVFSRIKDALTKQIDKAKKRIARKAARGG